MKEGEAYIHNSKFHEEVAKTYLSIKRIGCTQNTLPQLLVKNRVLHRAYTGPCLVDQSHPKVPLV